MTTTVCELVARVLGRPSVELSDLTRRARLRRARLLITETVEKHFKLDPASFDEGEVAGRDRVIDITVSLAESGGRKGT
jgi:hypothetical protein